MIAVGAVLVKSGLFEFADPAVFSKDAVGKPHDDWPENVKQQADLRAPNHHQAEGVVGALFAIDWDVDVP